MIYNASQLAVGLFVFFVLLVLCLSFYFARKTKSSKSYFAAGGTIHWGVNGIAFAGDYLSAASFLGICGMIATLGYDGFLYSIGYLAGWVVALFIVAEPLKQMGEFTFADAIDSKFKSKGIQLMAGISTLVVSVCYLIPQMVGAGDLVTPLLGLPHQWGVIIVGVIVVVIVATAGMTSTTYVQFIKGALLIVFSTILVVLVLVNGLNTKPSETYHDFKQIEVTVENNTVKDVLNPEYKLVTAKEAGDTRLVKLEHLGVNSWWSLSQVQDKYMLKEAISITQTKEGKLLYNGEPKENKKFFQVGHLDKVVHQNTQVSSTGPVDPFTFLSDLQNSSVVSFSKKAFTDGSDNVSVWVQKILPGEKLMRPGVKFKLDEKSSIWDKFDFISLMLALFLGTAALPHVLIRYYTVPNPSSARKSTIVAIAAIGFFYILTLYMGLGAMVNGVLDVESSNMAAPLLARSIGLILFAIISAIAFATVLGTVSGLIVASSGAIAHDFITNFLKIPLTDKGKVMAGKIAALSVGVVAICLGILFKGMNVSYLVGLAFAVAASANFPAIIMLLFWKKTTSRGIVFSILVGMVTSITIIVLSPTIYANFGLGKAPLSLDNPAIISVPVSFLTLVVVSLLTQKNTVPADLDIKVKAKAKVKTKAQA
jgi:cation/acetate symporter